MGKTILKEIEGPTDVDSLISRWMILNKELSRGRAPLRVSLEKHQVEHMLIEKLKKVI